MADTCWKARKAAQCETCPGLNGSEQIRFCVMRLVTLNCSFNLDQVCVSICLRLSDELPEMMFLLSGQIYHSQLVTTLS